MADPWMYKCPDKRTRSGQSSLGKDLILLEYSGELTSLSLKTFDYNMKQHQTVLCSPDMLGVFESPLTSQPSTETRCVPEACYFYPLHARVLTRTPSLLQTQPYLKHFILKLGPGWPQVHCPPASGPQCWDYRYVSLRLALPLLHITLYVNYYGELMNNK